MGSGSASTRVELRRWRELLLVNCGERENAEDLDQNVRYLVEGLFVNQGLEKLVRKPLGFV